jgi:hypothetical protein
MNFRETLQYFLTILLRVGIFTPLIALVSCGTQEKVDALYVDGIIYSVDSANTVYWGMAIRDGKIVAMLQEGEESVYHADSIVQLGGNPVYPGFIDAHCHFLGYGLFSFNVDLVGAKSWEECVQRVVDFSNANPEVDLITGRGWDQNDWGQFDFPTRDTLDLLFPNTPVVLSRVDGHAIIANEAAIIQSDFPLDTIVQGGEVVRDGGRLTGVFIDAAENLIVIPEADADLQRIALLKAQEDCFAYGLTGVVDAGLKRENIYIIDSLQKAGELLMRMDVMISMDSADVMHFVEKGGMKSDRLRVGGVKFYADGALGSRGACLLKPYSDRHDHYGFLIFDPVFFDRWAEKLAQTDFQMNTHAIGDSANRMILETYARHLGGKNDRRWRVEHAQVIAPDDFHYFEDYDILPSVQPTHATSDMYWAEDRLGAERIKSAYAYRKLGILSKALPLGTDFPVEQINPLLTFYAAVARKDIEGWPQGGFNMENSLTREKTLRGMTIEAAYSSFLENEKGSLEAGKFADFIILDRDILKVDKNQIPQTVVLQTIINGQTVYAN